MIVSFDNVFTKKDDFLSISKNKPENVAALVPQALNTYNPENQTLFFEIIQELMSDLQPISKLLKDQINERMMQNNKWLYIGKSYFNGANNFNNYEINYPYEIEVTDGPSSYVNDGYAVLYLKSGGADSKRPITLRLKKDGNWILWGDSILGILSDIRPPEKDNPWG